MARTAPRAPRLLGAALLLLLLVPAARRAAGEARSPRGDGVRCEWGWGRGARPGAARSPGLLSPQGRP